MNQAKSQIEFSRILKEENRKDPRLYLGYGIGSGEKTDLQEQRYLNPSLYTRSRSTVQLYHGLISITHPRSYPSVVISIYI
jgi:hypothetical protein